MVAVADTAASTAFTTEAEAVTDTVAVTEASTGLDAEASAVIVAVWVTAAAIVTVPATAR